MEARSEQLGPSTPSLHSVEADSNIRNPKIEHEGHGLGVQRPSETAPEHRCDDGQDDGDADDPLRSGKSKGKSCVLVTCRSLLTITSQGERLGGPEPRAHCICGRTREGAGRSIYSPQGRLGIHFWCLCPVPGSF